MNEDDVKRVKSAAIALGEYFDTVQIVATRHESAIEDGTIIAHAGAGNYYGRVGSVRAWLTAQDESIRQDERQEQET